MPKYSPLYNSIRKFSKEEHVSFYMPGHKQGSAYDEDMLKDVFKLDVTELKDTDDLHNPKKAIKETLLELAKTYLAKESFLLVNGSTGGIQAMLMAACKSGDTVIIDRSCHRSVINSCAIFGVIPVFARQRIIAEFGIYAPVSADDLQDTINQHPEAKAVFITSPSYYGLCADISKIAELVHSHNMMLLVDEAHGAHFAYSDKFPKGSIIEGADMCVQSSHKTLPAPNQTAFLHVGSNRIDIDRLKQCISMLETTSPSYILMCYADLGHSLMKKNGKTVMDKLVSEVDLLKREVGSKTKLNFVDETLIGGSIAGVDPLRLVINFSNYNITGFKAGEMLSREYKIIPEMADLYNVVCIITYGNKKEDIKKLQFALLDMVKNVGAGFHARPDEVFIPNLPENNSAVNPQNAFNSDGECVLLKDSINRISKASVNVYPPGACAIALGERITEGAVDYISTMIKAGANVIGIEDWKIITVKR